MGSNLAVINTAKNYIGKLTYKFGSFDILNGYGDCSSFTEFCYRQAGVNVGGTTEQQYRNSYHVSYDDAKAGDLIFFKNTWDKPSGHIDGVEHVGIYIGNDEFIHLSDSGCKVSKVTDSYWTQHYLAVGRVTGMDYYDYNERTSTFDKINSVNIVDNSPVLNKVLRVVLILVTVVFGVVFFASAIGVKVRLSEVKFPEGGES